jgi:hypothetical protein
VCESLAASESPVEPESTTVETTTTVEASAAETTSMTSAAKAAATARECFVVRGHQCSDDKRGNERRRDFGSHDAFSVSLDGCGKNEDLLPRCEDLFRPTAIPDSQKLVRIPAFDGPYEAGRGIGQSSPHPCGRPSLRGRHAIT